MIEAFSRYRHRFSAQAASTLLTSNFPYTTLRAVPDDQIPAVMAVVTQALQVPIPAAP